MVRAFFCGGNAVCSEVESELLSVLAGLAPLRKRPAEHDQQRFTLHECGTMLTFRTITKFDLADSLFHDFVFRIWEVLNDLRVDWLYVVRHEILLVLFHLFCDLTHKVIAEA